MLGWEQARPTIILIVLKYFKTVDSSKLYDHQIIIFSLLTHIATGHKQEANKNVIPIISRADNIFSSRLFVTCYWGFHSCSRFLW